MSHTVLEMHRRLLLTTSSTYGVLAASVPLSFLAHRHLALDLAVASALAALLFAMSVGFAHDLGRRRGRLVPTLLLSGPLAPLWLMRRTRRWQPLVLVRPRPR